MYSTIGRNLAAHLTVEATFAAITDSAVELVPGAQHAGISRGRGGKFETIAPTSELPRLVDAIQYDLESGPCVDAILEDTVFRTPELAADPRWPEFGQRAYEATGVRSMLALRLYLEHDEVIAALNIYSTEPAAFDDSAQTVGTLLATHGGLAVAGSLARDHAEHLKRALASNREIGIALGVLMQQHKITREQAFDLLRIASQHSHRKLADIATEVADTGELQLPASVHAARSAG